MKFSLFYQSCIISTAIDRTIDHTITGEECKHECGMEGLHKGSLWCYTIIGTWNYCTIDGQECKQKCGMNDLHKNRKWCYTVSESPKWDYCYPCKQTFSIQKLNKLNNFFHK